MSQSLVWQGDSREPRELRLAVVGPDTRMKHKIMQGSDFCRLLGIRWLCPRLVGSLGI